MQTRQLNFGIIGAGRIGQVHAESLCYRLPQANVLAIADIFGDAARAAAQRFHIPQATDDFSELLANPAIDAIAICSSTPTHAPLMIAAAQAGKHIFCEKPIALDLARIDEALAAVAQSGVKLQIGFNRRFDSNFQRIRQGIADGEIGVPHILRITSRDPAPPPIDYIKASGGIFLDMTIHDFDMARFLLADEVEDVYAQGGVMVDPAIGEAGDIDTAVITLRFRSGAIGVIDNSRQAVYGYDQRVEVFGSAGALAAQNNTPHRVTASTRDGVTQAKPLYFFLERYMDSYVAEMGAFCDAILYDQPIPVSGNDGRIPVVMGMASWKSYREQRPVRLDEIGL
ncbi:MAG: inositol 2-dehydrogenase [Caldilineaceae bacterium]|nr:inositol 2-dehydrogenase [Caldilineaceae bacterium]HRJ44987.1 inositol 2-dehydrogenase [Caldilineaceae bacterium]